MAKTDKICIVCGEGFKGTAKAECCGPNCRKRLERLRKAGLKPEFELIGGKNSKPPATPTIKKEKPPVAVKDLNQTSVVKPITDQPPKTNYSINNTGAYINDAIRKKLGWSKLD
jgi:hypothetical protein